MCNSIFLLLAGTKIMFHATDLFSLPGIPAYLKFLLNAYESSNYIVSQLVE